MNTSLALLEYGSVAAGVLAVDRMLKRSPVSLLRCGTVHPGRYLALVGGTVAAVEEAHAEGEAAGRASATLIDEVCLPDPHAALAASLTGTPGAPEGDTVGVLEVASSAALLRLLDRALKAVPIALTETRLADDLGGKAVAVISGGLADVQEAMALAGEPAGAGGEVIGVSIMANADPHLLRALAEGTRFGPCRDWAVAGAETLED